MKYDNLFTEIGLDIESIPSDDLSIQECKSQKEGWLRIKDTNPIYKGLEFAFVTSNGRHKRSVARAMVYRGNRFNDDIIVNGIPFKDYFQGNSVLISEIENMKQHIPATQMEQRTRTYDQAELTKLGSPKGYVAAHVSVEGGGLTGQAKAVRLAIAKATSKMGLDEKASLRKGGFMTTDARRKERKKYGLKKARKASQFSKR